MGGSDHPGLVSDAAGPPAPADAGRLADWLLGHGGDTVVWQPTHPYLLGRLLNDGRVTDGTAARVRAGDPNACHTNTASRAARHLDETIVTGWALAHGRWVPHSWTTMPDGTVVETTAGRDRYAGVALDDVESVVFCANEAAGDALVAADPGRWLPVLRRLLDAAGPASDAGGTASWDLVAAVRGG